ncbi:heterokaryon incompatibility protein [Rutstroemia sp. NJR-2017a WRK4]|nr:heterokaryon incompatibility protein [Rutstroemia sp. NJR-2017a WRK4]
MLCQICERLNVEDLLALKKTNDDNNKMFGEDGYIYWEHHSTYNDLEAAAKYCELCDLIVSSAKNRVELPRMRWSSFLMNSKNFDLVVFIAEERYSRTERDSDGRYKAHFDKEVFDSLVFAQRKLPIPFRLQGGAYPSLAFSMYFSAVPFDLETPRGHIKHINGKQIGHFPLVDELDSEESYGIGREWIQNCIGTHTDCAPIEDKMLPTRLIDVGSEESDPRLVQMGGLGGKYLALSHCWGGSISNCLTLANIQAFQKKIPLSELPVNFRDAVLITRSLGFRYLWIDSLCIIQDSNFDWESESSNMGNIFRNAFLTIAAARALNANDGILNAESVSNRFHRRRLGLDSFLSDGRCTDQLEARLRIWRDQKSEDTVNVVTTGDLETLDDIHINGALNLRGWILQEQVFSPRILYFGAQHIYWRCLHGYLAANGVPVNAGAVERYVRLLPSFHVHSRPSESNLEDVMAGYHELIMAYSVRNLTYASDKLPAFGGIASYVHSLVGGYYLAGIMSSCFREGLLWFLLVNSNEHAFHLHRAPSWSWAIVDGRINLKTSLLPLTPNDAKLVGHHIAHTGENPYGSVQAGYILIEGMTLAMYQHDDRSRSPNGYVQWDNPQYVSGVWFSEHNGSSYMAIQSQKYEENVDYVTEGKMKYLFVAIEGCGTPHSASRSDQPYNSPRKRALGLCLIENQDSDADSDAGVDGNVSTEVTYRRVGYVPIKIKSAEQWAVTITSKGWKRETLKLV